MNPEKTSSEELDSSAPKPEQTPDLTPAPEQPSQPEAAPENQRAEQDAAARQKLEELYDSSNNVEIAMPGLEVPRKPESIPEEPDEKSSPEKIVEDHLSLNSLQAKVERLRGEVEQLRAEKNIKTEIEQLELEKRMLQTEALGKELEKLLDLRERLVKKITGRDLEGDAGKKTGEFLGYPSEEEYIKGLAYLTENRIRAEGEKRLIGQEFAKLSKKEQKKYGDNPALFQQKIEGSFAKLLKDSSLFPEEISDGICGLLAAGYKIQGAKNVNFFSRRIENFLRPEIKISTLGGKKIRMSPENFAAMVKAKGEERKNNIADEARTQLEEEWEDEVKRQAEKIIEEETRDIDGAIERIKKAYREMRDNMVSEYLDGLDGEEATSQKLKAIEKTFGQKGRKGRNIESFFNDILNKEGKLSGLNGDPKKNIKALGGFFSDYGTDASSGAIQRSVGGGGYEKAKNQEGGLLRLVIEILKKVAEGFKSRPARA